VKSLKKLLILKEYYVQNSISTFNNKIKDIIGEPDLLSFIESAVKLYEPGKTASEWFKEQSKAHIVESESKYADTSLYNKMKNDGRLRSHLIPLLNLSTDNIYAISIQNTFLLMDKQILI